MYGNTRDASDVIRRNDYSTRYIGYTVKENNTVNAIVNMLGGSGAANEASELTYLKIGCTVTSNINQVIPAPAPRLPIVATFATFTGLGIVFTPTPYAFDGSSNLYTFSPLTTTPLPFALTALATDGSNLYVASTSNLYTYTSGTLSNLNITNLTTINKVTVASNGFYFLQSGNSQIYFATSNSAATSLAGSTAGFAEGIGSVAQFNQPRGFTLDPAGQYLYIADTGNSLIRKMSTVAPYTVSTLAGNTTFFFNPLPTDSVGNRDGNGIYGLSLLYNPYDITVTPEGVFYIADATNNAIRGLTPNGTLFTLGGIPGVDPVYDISPPGFSNAPGADGRWNEPVAITYFNSALYITEPLNNAIRSYTF
jgi:sugar lactone lactonase YvrE